MGTTPSNAGLEAYTPTVYNQHVSRILGVVTFSAMTVLRRVRNDGGYRLLFLSLRAEIVNNRVWTLRNNHPLTPDSSWAALWSEVLILTNAGMTGTWSRPPHITTPSTRTSPESWSRTSKPSSSTLWTSAFLILPFDLKQTQSLDSRDYVYRVPNSGFVRSHSHNHNRSRRLLLPILDPCKIQRCPRCMGENRRNSHPG